MTIKQYLLLALSLTLVSGAFAQDEDDAEKALFKKARKETQELVKKYSQPGERVVVIVVPEEELKLFFLEDPTKREKVEAKVLIADEDSVFKGKISPGGQSTLKSATPNLRVKKLKNVTGDIDSLVGVDNISGTTRINPLTMDEGYVATKFYQDSLNKFGLVPQKEVVAGTVQNFNLNSKFTKVIYVPMDKTGKLLEANKINAGVHLVNNHPVKFLADAQTDSYAVEAVARSRYNIVNVQEKLKLMTPDPETETYSSMNSSKKTTPHRVELSWAADDAKKLEMQKLITDVYAAPLNFKGEALYKELAKSMDVDQMFRFLAFNHIIRNGDISDEYFWFTQKDKKTGQVVLRIMPQDGDDLLKGVHMFPFNKEQIGLIAKDKLKIPGGFMINLEDPLFRTIRNDPFLYERYLETYKGLAQEIASSAFLDTELKNIEKELNKFANDPEVLKRGLTDEVAKAYDKDSFSKRAQSIRDGIKANADDALLRIGGELKKAQVKKTEQAAATSLKVSCFKNSVKKLLR